MNKKLIYPLTLFAIVVSLGLFAFAGVSSANAGPAAQDTVVAPTIQVTVNPPAVTQVLPPAVNVTAVVPVTGTDQVGPNILTLLFYGFLGLLALGFDIEKNLRAHLGTQIFDSTCNVERTLILDSKCRQCCA
jgi:ABC-type dipeptide/oligopeptide/nickel transport system permease subunit